MVWGERRGQTAKGKRELGRGAWSLGNGAWCRMGLILALMTVGIPEAFAQSVGDYRSNAAIMNWSVGPSWERWDGDSWEVAANYPGQVAGTGRVTIQSGHTVTINATPATAVFSLVVEASGILQYQSTTARTLRVSDMITINSGGTFRSAVSGNITTHQLIIGGSIVNNGTLNFSTNNNAAGAGITFTGAANEVFDLAGATLTNLRYLNGLILNKGTSATSVLSFIPGGTFQVRSGNMYGFLSIISGTFSLMGENPFSNPLFYASGGSYTIPVAGGFRLDNSHATIVGMYGTLINAGELIIRDGTYNIGTGSGNELLTTSTGRFEMSGGTVNISGRFRTSGGDCMITGGTMNLATVGHANRTLGAFHISQSADLIISGTPLITFTNPNSNSITPYNDIEIINGTGVKTISGGTFQLGTAATPPNRTFLVNSDIPLYNLTVDNSNTKVSLTDHLSLNNQLTLNGQLLLNDKNLVLGTSAPVIAGNFGIGAGMMVPGSGEVRKLVTSNGSYNFPIGEVSGSTKYLPLTLNFTSGSFGSGAYITVKMFNSTHPQNTSVTNFLNRYWTISTSGITNPVYNITATYADGDIVGNESNIKVGIYSSAWVILNPLNLISNTINASGLTGNLDISGISLDAPTVAITNLPIVICSGTSIILTTIATGDLITYLWTPAAGLSETNIANPVASPTTSTEYTVTVTDGNGKTVSARVTVTVNPLPAISIIYHN